MNLSAGEAAAVREQPTFSFLTTAYQAEGTLARTIDSVRAQTRTDWEMVVVDNGNSDAVAAVVTPYLADPRIGLIRQENRGATEGVMSASRAARGRYFVVLNADDLVASDFCARMGEILAANAGIAAVTCDAFLFRDPGRALMSRSYLQTAGRHGRPAGDRPLRLADLLDGPCPYYSGPIRRDVWDAMGGLYTDTPIVDDLDFWLRTVLAGYDVRMISDRLAYYRLGVGSLSRPVDPVRIEAFEEQRERALIRAARGSGQPEDLAALGRVLRRLHYHQALRRTRLAIAQQQFDEARRQGRKAFAERKTLRVGTMIVTLRIAPTLAARAHPLKQRAQARLNGDAAAFTAGSPSGPDRLEAL